MAQNEVFRLQLQPWPGDYEAPITVDPDPAAEAVVETTVETPAWEALSCRAPGDGPEIVFVDGCRRVEARLLATFSGGLAHGLFGSLAVGALRCRPGGAGFLDLRVDRHLILGAGLHRQREVVRAGSLNLVFEGCSIAGNTPQELLVQLQNLMREAEAELAGRQGGPARCVFVDGPLTYFSGVAAPFVGIIKTIHAPYLDWGRFELLYRLRRGERTPLFAITDGKYDRYSWFQRLAAPRLLDHPLSGLLRLEVRSGLGLDAARRLADFAGAVLPRFASDAARDPRSPQNLLPVGMLEAELRHRMGDPLFLRRAIERRIYEEVSA